jgi:hypothetical protein
MKRKDILQISHLSVSSEVRDGKKPMPKITLVSAYSKCNLIYE